MELASTRALHPTVVVPTNYINDKID